jgi:hypothetical protein
MSLFLQMSGVIGADRERVRSAIEAWYLPKRVELREYDPEPDDLDHVLITETNGNTTVLYPPDFTEWDDLSQHLSKTLPAPVFSLHVHSSDLWMYILFVGGRAVDHFNTRPDYWDAVDDAERDKWRGRAAVVAEHVRGVQAARVDPYLTFWNDSNDGQKAHPDDEFTYGTDWQVVDFMKAVGLPYEGGADKGAASKSYGFMHPDDGDAVDDDNEAAEADALPSTNEAAVSTVGSVSRGKPWWKFW